MKALLASAVLVLAGCQDRTVVDLERKQAELTATVERQRAELDRLQALENLQDAAPEISTPRRADPPRDEEIEKPASPRIAEAQYPDNCYKDYCPCEPPQGGADTLLCDQLQEGIPVDIQLMIAGRGGREARRQLEEWEASNS